MDIKKYLELQQLRNKLKVALKDNLKSDATTLLRKYEKQLKLEIDKSANDSTFSSFNVKAIVEEFSTDIYIGIENKKAYSVEKFTKLWEDAKATLDVQYKTDYAVLPTTKIDKYKILGEIDAIIKKYRDGKLTELRMKRAITSRLRFPAHTANTIANTQIAGFDNLASKAVADLAFLEKAMYFGPATHPDLSHDLCITLMATKQLYTEAQIKKMSNGVGLPVLIYCGGFNCLHEWVWVDASWEELKEYKLKAA